MTYTASGLTPDIARGLSRDDLIWQAASGYSGASADVPNERAIAAGELLRRRPTGSLGYVYVNPLVGPDGFSGYSGGDSGYSGATGGSGYSGAAGISGYSGSGRSGYSGVGTSGYSG